MSKAEITKQTLLEHGRRLFWSRGYSNVTVREVAMAAKVDVALISRYFGSKRKLFEATLELVGGIDPVSIADERTLIDAVVKMFVSAPRTPAKPSPVTMILMNARDSEVGQLVRKRYVTMWLRPLERILGDDQKAAMFSAAMFGLSVAEKTLNLPGIAPPTSTAYERQLRHLLKSAISHSR